MCLQKIPDSGNFKEGAVTDEELVRAVAVEVMGWHDEGIHSLASGNYQGIRNWWIRCYGLDEEPIMPAGDWQPLTNANHWMMVVERMRELGWWFYADPNPHYYPGRHGEISYDIGFFKIKCEKRLAEVCGCEKITGEFVCQAALEAVRR